MKFHNVQPGVYCARVTSAASRTLLARLRASARLAVLVLLVFALKLGAAAACVKHDFADMGFGTDGSHAVAVKASPLDGGNDDSTKLKLGHAACSQCLQPTPYRRQEMNMLVAVYVKRPMPHGVFEAGQLRIQFGLNVLFSQSQPRRTAINDTTDRRAV